MIKVFFLLTPFFALSMFLSYTADYDKKRKRKTAVKTSFAVIIITLLIYWFGEYLFKVLGITIDAFTFRMIKQITFFYLQFFE